MSQGKGFTRGSDNCGSTELNAKGAGTTNTITKFVGFDVSKEKIPISVASNGTAPTQFCGVIRNTEEDVRKLLRRFGEAEEPYVCYEVGVTEFKLARFLEELGIKCMVAAPSKIPQTPGPKGKTDRRDSLRLAELLRAGELIPVWVPGEDDEALKDLIRAYKARNEDLKRAKQRVSMSLLRHGLPKTWKDEALGRALSCMVMKDRIPA